MILMEAKDKLMTCNEHHQSKDPRWFLSGGSPSDCTLAGISYFLLSEHRTHLAVALPYQILLACPLMHSSDMATGNMMKRHKAIPTIKIMGGGPESTPVP